MKYITSTICIMLASLSSSAQTTDTTKVKPSHYQQPETTRYLLPDGKIVSADKLDSVLASWKHQPFAMVHYDNKPGIVGLIPQTEAMKKQFAEERSKTNVMLNLPAPEFNLNDISGRHYRLSEQKGKVVVLNFWFTSCAPCRAEMPLLNNVKKNADPKKVIFLALALDNPAAVQQFLQLQSFEYTLLANAREVHAAYHVTSCPTSMVIDTNGIIRFIETSGEDIDKKLFAAIEAAR